MLSLEGDKFLNKYRIKTTRLQDWDYSWDGCYFITICTQNKEHYFGKILNGIMQLSDIGKIAKKYWQEIPNHFSDVKLDEFIVMPNHVHGIIIIDKNEKIDDGVETLHCNVSTTAFTTSSKFYSKISPKQNSIPTIIRSYKSICTKIIKTKYHDFSWQTRYYDHIIRNEKSLNYIREYINNNPKNWMTDRNNIIIKNELKNIVL